MDIIFKDTNLDDIFTKLYLIPDRVQFCHHSTTSYAAHKALDGAYDALSGLKDSIVEKLIGYTKKRPVRISLEPISGYSEAMNFKVAEEICAFGDSLLAFAKKNGYSDIENLAQDYCGEGAQLSYLLSLK